MRERLAGHERRFNALFEAYFDTLRSTFDAPEFSTFAPECLDLVRELSLRGGKRIRVVLVHEAARLVTDEPVAGLDDAALSVELLQTHGLIHDDLIDDSPVGAAVLPPTTPTGTGSPTAPGRARPHRPRR